MKRKYYANHPKVVPLLLLSVLLAIPAQASPQDTNSDFLRLYFDESQLVETATRSPKPITQVAENVTVITAEDIGAMHAHSLAEVLETVPGFNVDRYGADFNGPNLLFAHGTRREHILVLVDGQRRNSSFNFQDDLKGIPLAIIDRIEIVRGPASTSWGSSMGGVINIFTKSTGRDAVPSGSVELSRGENGTGEYGVDLAGRAGRIGYYLYAGRQESDGLYENRFYDDDRFHAKISTELPHNSLLTFSAGLSDPDMRTGAYAYPAFGVVESEDIADRTNYVSAYYQTMLTSDLNLNLGLRHFKRQVISSATFLPGTLSAIAPVGAFGYATSKKEENSSMSLEGGYRLNANHHLSFGGEMLRNELNSSTVSGDAFQTVMGDPPLVRADPAYEQIAGLYVNDTYSLGKWTLSPGIRYDNHSIAGSFASAGLGLTYRLTSDTLLRGLVARGFTYPLLNYLVNGTSSVVGNPDLKPEKLLSWQMGIETTKLEYVILKGTVFLRNVDDTWSLTSIGDWEVMWKNSGSVRRQGYEFEVESIPWHNLSLAANTTFTHQEADDLTAAAELNNDARAVNVVLRYNDKKLWRGDLRAHYNWLGAGYLAFPLTGEESQMDTVIWDFSLTRRLTGPGDRPVEVYTKVRNLFSGANYTDYTVPNPGRWIEVGMKYLF